ncbi:MULTISPECIES: DUF58 domain-containing protein [unclassified Rhizobium]|uniref:DUF58 domain-containing protein n=1 Tax=unclassified Rhizobium TaxID=2613769 RepID=UPI0006F813D1|nr:MULTISPECIES: DUF58 domain-containing protein [unclassified Rhizobium]KQV41745.1 MoxR protein [Rhizobium sp. Root1212]KRD32261.1 MoxR protein [Rhizobium sp. Root268]
MPTVESTQGVHVSTEQLVALEAYARDLSFVQKSRSHQQLAGRMQSSMRGRGLTFEELRDYLPGDDIRSIDWRVTARTNKPVVRVYSEEKERPALIVVDQRINMFFGSRRAMKSVTAAEAAMLCAWRILGSGDRVGGFVFNDSDIDEVRPHRSREAVITLAGKIAAQNGSLEAGFAGTQSPASLDAVLHRVAAIAHHDHLIVVISDFNGHSAATRDLLLRLSDRNDVICILVYDPFLLDLPTSGDIVVSGGGLQAELPLRRADVKQAVDTFARERGRELRNWQKELGLPMLPVSAAEETAPQLRRLLEQAAWRQRRR